MGLKVFCVGEPLDDFGLEHIILRGFKGIYFLVDWFVCLFNLPSALSHHFSNGLFLSESRFKSFLSGRAPQ